MDKYNNKHIYYISCANQIITQSLIKHLAEHKQINTEIFTDMLNEIADGYNDSDNDDRKNIGSYLLKFISDLPI